MSAVAVDERNQIEVVTRPRFSMRAMLIVVTCSSVFFFLLTVAPPVVAGIGLSLVSMLLATFLAAGAMYAGSNLKAFCRGALVPSLVSYGWLSWYYVQILGHVSSPAELFEFATNVAVGLRQITIGYTSLSAATGLLVLFFKVLVEPKQQCESSSNRRHASQQPEG